MVSHDWVHGSRLPQGYQSFTQASGLLRLNEPRDAFLSSLCTFTLSPSAEAAGLEPLPGTLSPRATRGGGHPCIKPALYDYSPLRHTGVFTSGVRKLTAAFSPSNTAQMFQLLAMSRPTCSHPRH